MALLMPLPIGLTTSKSIRNEERILYGFAAGVMGLSLIASLSRGGLIALGSELLFLLLAGSGILGRRSRSRDKQSADTFRAGIRLKSLAAIGVIIVSIGIGVIWLGPEPVADRIARGNATQSGEAESLYMSRGWIWRDSIRVIEAHPLLGVGMGAFETAFPMYSHSDGSLLVSQTHSDYLQVLTDCGVLGGLFAAWFIVAVWSAVFRGLSSADPLLRSVAIGCGAAISGMMVHSIFDFNLQLPSTALLFLIICAVASATSMRGNANQKNAAARTNIGTAAI